MSTAGFITWPAAALALLLCAHVHAQTACEQWLKSEFERASQVPVLGTMRVQIVKEAHWHPPEAEIARLLAEIEGRPDHPKRPEVLEYQRRLQGKPTTTKFTIWIPDAKSWRSSEDSSSATLPPGFYQDFCSANKESFTLRADLLSIQQPLDNQSPDAHSLRGIDARAFRMASIPLFGYLRPATFGKASLEDITCEGDRWQAVARIRSPSGVLEMETRIEGEWSESGARGFHRKSVVVSQSRGEPSSLGQTVEVGPWERQEGSDQWVCRGVRISNARGELEEVYRVEAALAVSDSEVRSVLRAPREGVDAFRGAVQPGVIVDRVKGQLTDTSPTGDRVVASLPPTTSSGAPKVPVWQWVGWGTLGCVIVSVVLVRLARRQS